MTSNPSSRRSTSASQARTANTSTPSVIDSPGCTTIPLPGRRSQPSQYFDRPALLRSDTHCATRSRHDASNFTLRPRHGVRGLIGSFTITRRAGTVLSRLALIATAAVVLAACGEDDPEPGTLGYYSTLEARGTVFSSPTAALGNDNAAAEAAILRQLDQHYKGQHGRVWDQLHPAQQALVSRDQYILCATDGLGDSEVTAEVTESYREPVAIFGTDQAAADSVAVTVRLSDTLGRSATTTYHLIDVGGGDWRWITDPSLYADGACPQ